MIFQLKINSNTTIGLDLFGPFIVKEGREELKWYGAIFICLSADVDGEGFNILQMNFGRDGRTNS